MSDCVDSVVVLVGRRWLNVQTLQRFMVQFIDHRTNRVKSHASSYRFAANLPLICRRIQGKCRTSRDVYRYFRFAVDLSRIAVDLPHS